MAGTLKEKRMGEILTQPITGRNTAQDEQSPFLGNESLGKASQPRVDALSVLLLDGESPYALSAATCLGQVPDVKLHVLSEDPWSLLRFSRYQSSFHLRHEQGDDEAIGT